MKDGLVQDIRFALRQLHRSPGFAITAVLTLALGIGANAAIFTIAHGFLMRQLPVFRPGALYSIGDERDCCIQANIPKDQQYSIFSVGDYRALRDALPEFSVLAALPANSNNGPMTARARPGEAARYLRTSYVSGNYFEMFGLSAARGRLLTPTDDRDGAPPVLVMSYSTWVNEFNADPAVVGETFLIDGKPATVIGVAPAGFYGDRIDARRRDFYTPLSAEKQLSDIPYINNPKLHALYLVGRVQPGTDLARLQSKIDNVLRAYLAQRPEYQSVDLQRELPRVHAQLTPAARGITRLQNELGKGIHILMALSGFVLLIACANVANLLLARGMARQAEMSVRMALGATRTRIHRQSITEGVLLATMGGALGIAVSFLGARAILALQFPGTRNLAISPNPSIAVLGFTFVLALFTGLLFGSVPAWLATRQQPVDALRGQSRDAKGDASLPQRSLLVVQTAMSLVLVTTAALLTRSLHNLQFQDFGLATENRVVVTMNVPTSSAPSEPYRNLMESLQAKIAAVPGTRSVAFGKFSPLSGDSWGENVYVEGRPDPGRQADTSSTWDRISPGFFSTVGQPLLRGRDFNPGDREGTLPVAIVNQQFARKYFPGEDALGKRFGTAPHRFSFTIVGVVADAKYSDLDQPTGPMFFRAMNQRDPNASPKDLGESISLIPNALLIQTRGAQAGYEQLVRQAIAQAAPDVAVIDVTTLNAQISDQFNDQRMVARLTSAFGLLALVLASVGLYGVTAYSVARRVREIGLRMALGSDRAGILGLILKGALVQTFLGLAFGAPATLLAGHLLQSQLFGVGGHDALTLLGACAVLALAAVIASALPARRASAIQPMQALRAE